MVGTILGPGTIFLMIVGSFNVALGMDNWQAFYVNLIPIIAYMIICMTAKPKFQASVYLVVVVQPFFSLPVSSTTSFGLFYVKLTVL